MRRQRDAVTKGRPVLVRDDQVAEKILVRVIGCVEVGHVCARSRESGDARGECAEDARGADEAGDVNFV